MNRASIVHASMVLAALELGCGAQARPDSTNAGANVTAAAHDPMEASATTLVAASAQASVKASGSAAEPLFPEFPDAAVLKLDAVADASFSGARAWVPRGFGIDPKTNQPTFGDVSWLTVDVKQAASGFVLYENALIDEKRLEAVPALFAWPTTTKLPEVGTIVRCAAFASVSGVEMVGLRSGELLVSRFTGGKSGAPECLSAVFGFVYAAPDGVWAFPTTLEPGAVVDITEGGKSKIAAEVYAVHDDHVWVRPSSTSPRTRKHFDAPLLRARKRIVKLMQLSLSTPWKVGDEVLTISEEGTWVEATISYANGDLSYEVAGVEGEPVRFPHQIAKR